MIRILFILLCASINCQEVINYKYWTATTDSLNRPVSVVYRLTEEMDSVNLGRKSFHGKTYFDFKNEFKGYERGHTIPAASFDFTEQVKHDVADLKFIVPQTRFINRGLVRSIENYERKVVEELGCIIVVLKIKHEDPIEFERDIYDCKLNKLVEFNYQNHGL